MTIKKENQQSTSTNIPNGVKKAPERPKLKMVTESFDPKVFFKSNR